MNVKTLHLLLAVFIVGFVSVPAGSQQIQIRRPFRVSDDIETTLFWPVGLKPQEVRFSPDGKFFVVYTEKGNLDQNSVEDSLRFYLSREVEEFLTHPNEPDQPSPVWVLKRCNEEGPVIDDWRWLPDSSGVAFLEGAGFFGERRLVLAETATKSVEVLTPMTENVKSYDIRDALNYAYSLVDPAPLRKLHSEHHAAAMVGTGRSSLELAFPDDPIAAWILSAQNHLSVVLKGKRFNVPNDGTLFLSAGDFALSPDGTSLITQQVVPEVPESWETLYPPPLPSDPHRIRAGRQDLGSGRSSVRQFVRIDLPSGSVEPLTGTPSATSADWDTGAIVRWSADGQAILLPGTFVKSVDARPSRPCVAVVDLRLKTTTCLETLKGRTESGFENGYRVLTDAWFIDGDRTRVMLKFSSYPDHRPRNAEYRSEGHNAWRLFEEGNGKSEVGQNGMEIMVEERLDQPPVLVGKEQNRSRLLWDPNPQLKDVDLGQATVYKWRDDEGREWTGGLYRPSNTHQGGRLPLLIQTHGFFESHFAPSGLYATGNAAREMSTVGILVLQVDDSRCASSTPSEESCAVAGYAAAARQLVSENVADPERIAISGFSHTCLYVMETLTTGSMQIKAAAITDGQIESYAQYILTLGYFDSSLPREFNEVIGSPPFGEGLQRWLKHSPGFNLDKVNAPLLVVGEGVSRTLTLMWEPYAALRSLRKPVDLIMLNTDEHVLTSPAIRMASQGGAVDWFRFWLQGFEEPDPAKADQYARWRALRRIQSENQANSKARARAKN